MRLTYEEMAACLGVELPENTADEVRSIIARRAVTDSREAAPESLFVCIAGEHVDGHDYAAAAVEKGASIVLAARALPGIPVPVLVVGDTVVALGKIAACWRNRTRAKVVCVTGSCGKTTVKETLHSILSVHGKTVCNPLNRNNQIGMPCAVLDADGDEDFWVFEAGISHPGDMDELAGILRPDIGLIVNVGDAHTEGLGDMGVAWHKTRLLNYLSPEGFGLVSADYPDLLWKAVGTHVPLHFFSAHEGVAGDSAYFARYLGRDAESGNGRYELCLAGKTCTAEAPFIGTSGAEDCIAAAACADLLGLDTAEILEGLRKVAALPQRCHMKRRGGWIVMDDTYNANPLSMRRMLETARDRAGEKPLVLVLGEMGELGKKSAELHNQLGRDAAKVSPAAVFWKGGRAEAVRSGLDAEGYNGPWFIIEGEKDFLEAWRSLRASVMNPEEGLVLFKGSRSNRLESVLEAFPGSEGEGGDVL